MSNENDSLGDGYHAMGIHRVYALGNENNGLGHGNDAVSNENHALGDRYHALDIHKAYALGKLWRMKSMSWAMKRMLAHRLTGWLPDFQKLISGKDNTQKTP